LTFSPFHLFTLSLFRPFFFHGNFRQF
jgi:hypothetical protein